MPRCVALYDWSQLTTVAWNDDPQLMCTAHAAGARVVLDGRGADSPVLYANATARAEWISDRVRFAQERHLDGINFDLEDPIAPGNPLARAYAALVAEAATAFHAAIPGSQVSVDVPWSPHGIDGRHYDWAGLAAAADLLFVMAYDMQSQIWGSCVASANSPLPLVRRGLGQWLELGVPAKKLVLGLPWYGYVYPCTNSAYQGAQERLCALPPVAFRGCPCSDAAGRQMCYADIARAIRRGRRGAGSIAMASSASSREAAAEAGAGGTHSGSGGSGSRQRRAAAVEAAAAEGAELVCEQPALDGGQASLVARCHYASNASDAVQVWFDNPASLTAKYRLAAELRLRGVGFWNLECLDYSCADAQCRQETQAMWAAVRAFTGA
ncbi:hypothetical protein ABPG75_003208 [Micractinium tetrahymenae]